MEGIHFRVGYFDHPLAEFKDRDEAMDYAKRKARELRGKFAVHVSRVDPVPLGEHCASFRSDSRGRLPHTEEEDK